MTKKTKCIYRKLKEIDFLGDGINFTINNQSSLKTAFGGFLRLVLYIASLSLFLFFGKDFIFGLDPRTSYQIKEPLEPLAFTYTANDFFFAVSFENYFKSYVDISDYFHIQATYNQMFYNNHTTKFDLGSKSIKMVNCSDIIFDENTETLFDKKRKKEYLCPLIPKGDKLTITGNTVYFDEKMFFFELKLIFCNNLNDKANKNCKDYKSFFNEYLKNEDLYVSIMIKDNIFDKNNKQTPLKKNVFVYENIISKNLIKRDYVYITNTELIEDSAMFFSSEKIYREDGYSKYDNHFLFFEEIKSDDQINNITNNFYSLEILADRTIKSYTRRYKKIQDVFPVLSSFINLLLINIRGIYAFYYKFKKQNYFFKRLIRISDISKNNKNDKNKNDSIENSFKIDKDNKGNQGNNIQLNSVDLTIRNMNLTYNQRLNENSTMNNLNLDKESIHRIINESNLHPNFSDYERVSVLKIENSKREPKHAASRDSSQINDSSIINVNNSFQRNFSNDQENRTQSVCLNNESIEDRDIKRVYDNFSKEKNKIRLKFWEKIKIKFISNNKGAKSKYYFRSEEFYKLILNKFDVFYYLKKMKNLSLMKKCLLEENELSMLNFISGKYYSLDNKIYKAPGEKIDSLENFKKIVDIFKEGKDNSQVKRILLNEFSTK